MKNDEKEWLVSRAACSGCYYYRHFCSNVMGCHYTLDTGKIRHEKPKECTVKREGKWHPSGSAITLPERGWT